MTLPGLNDTGRATSKSLSNKELTIFRVGIFTTLKMVKQLSHSDLQVAQKKCTYYDSRRRLPQKRLLNKVTTEPLTEDKVTDMFLTVGFGYNS